MSGTSDNGHSEEWTTSLEWTHSSSHAYVYIIVHIFLPPKKGLPLNNGQINTRPQLVHYSEVPLYMRLCIHVPQWGRTLD